MADYIKKLRPILYNPNNSKDKVLAFIKNEVNVGEFNQAINLNPLLKKARALGTNFSSIHDIFQRNTFGYTDELRRELFWLLYNIENFSVEISSFLKRKESVETLILFGKFDEANICLQETVNEFGENLWSIELRLMLKEFQLGTKFNWEMLSELLKNINSPFYKFIINFFSKRIEENMSFENCFAQFQNEFDSVTTDPMVKDFLVFKSIPIANYEYNFEDLRGVLFVTNIFGTIDQYNIVIDSIVKLVSKTSEFDKIILPFLRKLNVIIQDNKIKNLINLIDTNSQLILLNDTAKLLPIFDEYSKGKFEECFILVFEEIKKSPKCFELYEIYCKCLINLKRKFKKSQVSGIVDSILYSVYRTLQHDRNSNEHRKKLQKYSLIFLSQDFGKQIYSFTLSLIRDSDANEFALISNLVSIFNNPRILNLDLRDRDSSVVEKFKILDYSNSTNYSMFFREGETYVDIEESCDIIQQLVYKARSFYQKNMFKEIIFLIEPYIINDEIISPFYYDEILYLLIESYIESGDLLKALRLSANILSSENFYTNKFNAAVLMSKIKENGIENFAEYIELPILFSYSLKDYDLYEIYIEFMLYNDEEYPSKLNIEKLIERFTVENLVYFLNEVCAISTMQYSLEFSSIDKAEIERVEICNVLKEIDPKNRVSYDLEIADILRASAVRKALKEVNDGRLYINIESLKNQQQNTIRESFERYKEIESTTKEKNLIGFNASKEGDWKVMDFIQKEIDPHYTDPTYLAFKSIYMDTREKFLYSKEYGLDSCLSTNFRHGSVKNHIRSVFEKLNLITSKLGDFYIDNNYWAEKFLYDSELNLQIQERLKTFSDDIDQYTLFIVNNLIQITTERVSDKDDGLFNYSTNDKILWTFFKERKDMFDSADAVIEILYTNLITYTKIDIYKEIAEVFSESINDSFQKMIEYLQIDLRNLGVNNQSELLPNILTSSTNIQKELEVISNWFTLNTTSSSSLLDIETIINASKEYTNRINPNNCINPKMNIGFPMPAYSSLIFVFNILFNNIIEHSKLGSQDLDVSVDVFNPKDKYIEIKITNSISSELDLTEIESKLSVIKNNWNKNKNIERSNTEGGSGFDKIKRILLYEAMAKTDKFQYTVEYEKVSVSLFLPFKSQLIGLEHCILASFYSFDSVPKILDITVDDLCENVKVESGLIFAINTLLVNLVQLSDLTIDESDLKVAVNFENDFLEFNFTINGLSNRELQTKKDILKKIHSDWGIKEIAQQEGDNATIKSFEKLKNMLYYDSDIDCTFDYHFNGELVSIILTIPNKFQNESINN